MANMVCANCGASIEEGARFCRQCGRPIVYTEATTRELDPPQYFEPQTRPVSAADTSPTYSPMMGMPAHATQSMEGRGQKKTIIILSAVVAVLFIALLVVILAGRQSPLVTVQTPPDAPRGPVTITPGGRPAPVQPPRVPEAPMADEALVYPGAEKKVTRVGDAEIINLKTTDDFDTVIKWYHSIPGIILVHEEEGESSMLQVGNAVIHIAMEGEETNIMIAKGGPPGFPLPR